MVYPYLTYCNIVWASTYPTRLEGIYKIQRKIVRIAKFSKFTQDTSPIFLFLLNLLTIYELNSYLLALFMYTYFRWQLPPSFSDYFLENNTIHSCNTRSANKVYIKYERTNYRRFSVRYRGAMIWNSLPNSLKEIKSLQLFKRKLKCFFSRNILTPNSGTYIKCNTLNSY